MDVEIKREAAFAGQRVKQKVIFALALCSVIPLLVLTYVIHGHLVPGVESPTKGLAEALAIPTLVAFTGLLMAGGRHLGGGPARAGPPPARLLRPAPPTGGKYPARRNQTRSLPLGLYPIIR